MSMRRRRWAIRVVTTLLAAAAVPVVSAGTAQAAVSGLTQVSTNVDVPANSSRTVTLTCSSGWTAVSGGWHVFSGDNLYGLVIGETRPVSGKWRFTIHNTAAWAPQQMTLYATCARDFVDSISVFGVGQSIPAGTNGHLVAGCPTGWKVLGGGFELGHNDVVPLWSAPRTAPQQGWDGFFRNKGSTVMVNTYSVCGKAVDHYLTSAIATVNPGEERTVDAGCTHPGVVTAGGWRHGFTDHIPLRQSFFFNPVWRNTVKNTSRSTQITITTLAVCIRLA